MTKRIDHTQANMGPGRDAAEHSNGPGDAVTRLLLTERQVAECLGVSPRHVRGLRARGRLPAPIKLGAAVRWSLAELRAWVDQGAPERVRWERLKDQSR